MLIDAMFKSTNRNRIHHQFYEKKVGTLSWPSTFFISVNEGHRQHRSPHKQLFSFINGLKNLSTAVVICGRAKGSLSDLRAGLKASMTSSLIRPLR